MSSRTIRFIQWGIALIVAAVIFGAGQISNNMANKPEKQLLTVYAPADMEDAFEDALKMSELKETHQIVMSDDPNSNICVAYAKQGDKAYQKFAFSPFVVGYDTSTDCFDMLIESGIIVESAYDSDEHEIDFLKIIKEAISQGQWKNLGIEEQGNLHVFYPDKEGEYWNDFHDFLLVTVNNGKYPTTESEINNAENIINKFLNSEYTEGIIDFREQVRRTGGFPSTAIYILPEKDLKQICVSEDEAARLLFPTKTVYLNYYVKGDELGNQVIKSFDKTSFWYDFYYVLKSEYYRSTKISELSHQLSNVYSETDVYNVAKIPEIKEVLSYPTSE